MKIKIRQHHGSMPQEDGWSQQMGDWLAQLGDDVAHDPLIPSESNFSTRSAHFHARKEAVAVGLVESMIHDDNRRQPIVFEEQGVGDRHSL